MAVIHSRKCSPISSALTLLSKACHQSLSWPWPWPWCATCAKFAGSSSTSAGHGWARSSHCGCWAPYT